MNKLKYRIAGIFLLVVLFSACQKTCMDDFEKLSEKLAENGGGGSGNSCLEGTWFSDACGDPQGVVWKFNSGGTGSFSNPDCNGICNPIVFNFSYSVSGSTCSISYDAQQPVVLCTGFDPLSPPSPSDESFEFECSGSTLTVNSSNGTAVFTK